ncbi:MULTISPECIES: hypothetical protein [Caldimonas]|uniref:hypothetical protein n=1 Tax=Caldimonas TaxID=196013 RepID=UPI0003753C2E|nr:MULTISPECIES: hypothetical protein [Caldimonas]MCX7659520.1 hypothetical protein [Caldimonas manganoxidans]GIX23569.1 MAG: hypothetical protein KatS3mg122_0800 [Caldimonas sp.]
MPRIDFCRLLVMAACITSAAPAWSQTVYRCPGNHFTNALTPKEAEAKGCRVVEGGNVTIVESRRPPPAAARPSGGGTSSAAASPGPRIDPNEQRARDSDARRILEAELRREEEALAALRKEYNNGEPERRGDERNYQKYLDRVAALQADIARKEADIASIRRELARLPAAP